MYFLPCMQLCSCLHLQNIMGLSHYSTYPFTMWTSHRWPSSSLKRFIEMSWIIQKGKKVSVCNYWTGTMRVSAWSCWCFNRNKCRKWLGHGGKSQNITVVLESVSLVLCLLTLNPLSLMRRREGRYHRLLHLGQHTRGKEDVASNFARGHYTIEKEICWCMLEPDLKTSQQFYKSPRLPCFQY